MIEYAHRSVLINEAIKFLAVAPGKIYLDGTVGGGGYAERILEEGASKVICLDVDGDAVKASRERLETFGDRALVMHGSYAEASKIVGARYGKVDGMVLDLGISSYQVDEASRGFSFMKDAPLDMRMDRSQGLTAADIVNKFREKELVDIFWNYGEERYSRAIARKIVSERRLGEIISTHRLADICASVNLKKFKIHPATRIFQALRIAVNSELENLERFLDSAPAFLKAGGRLVIISYHSLEDRIVKRKFKELARERMFDMLTKKPVGAVADEVRLNPRARSAKLRAVARTAISE